MNNSTDGNGTVNATDAPWTYSMVLQYVAPTMVMIDRVGSPIWYVIGLIGNPISARIWLSRKIRKANPSAVYFGSLAIVEFIYLILHFIMELELAWGIKTYQKPTVCEIFNFLLISPQYFVPMCVLGFTVERYIAVCHPFVKEKYCTVRRAKIVIITFAVTALAFGSLQMYIWTYFESRSACTIREEAMNNGFYVYWTWFTDGLLFMVIPVVILIINILVIREIRRLSSESAAMLPNQTGTSNAVSTITLLAVSFYFICTLFPATIVYAIQTTVPHGDYTLPVPDWPVDPTWRKYFKYLTIRKIVEEVCLSNYATYFIIYFATGAYFRKAFFVLFRIKKPRKSHKRIGSQSGATTDYNYSMVNSNGRSVSETCVPPTTPC